jgi:hypothetical protein
MIEHRPATRLRIRARSWGTRHRSNSVLAWALLLTLSACKHEPPSTQQVLARDIAPGRIDIEVISPRQGGDDYWAYRVTPSEGSVARTSVGRQTASDWEPLAPEFSAGQANCFQGSQASSPDQKLLARCFGERPGKPAQFTIGPNTPGDGNKFLFRFTPDRWRRIEGFVWSPNSRSIALLISSERYGKGPLERLWALAGHPVPHNTVYLDLNDVESGNTVEYLIRSDVVHGGARIVAWK